MIRSTDIRHETSIIYLGNNKYTYIYDVSEYKNTHDNTTVYNVKYVDVDGPITPNKITQVVIDAEYGNGLEQKLINEYNLTVLNIDTTDSESKINRYKEFLVRRNDLKKQIDSDFEKYINSKKQPDFIFN